MVGELKHLANSIESEWITSTYASVWNSSSSFSLMQHLPLKRSRNPRRFQNKRPSSPLPFHLQLRTSAISAAHIFRCCHKHRLVASEEAPVRVAVPCQPSSWADRLRGSLLSSVSPSSKFIVVHKWQGFLLQPMIHWEFFLPKSVFAIWSLQSSLHLL